MTPRISRSYRNTPRVVRKQTSRPVSPRPKTVVRSNPQKLSGRDLQLKNVHNQIRSRHSQNSHPDNYSPHNGNWNLGSKQIKGVSGRTQRINELRERKASIENKMISSKGTKRIPVSNDNKPKYISIEKGEGIIDRDNWRGFKFSVKKKVGTHGKTTTFRKVDRVKQPGEKKFIPQTVYYKYTPRDVERVRANNEKSRLVKAKLTNAMSLTLNKNRRRPRVVKVTKGKPHGRKVVTYKKSMTGKFPAIKKRRLY